MPSEDLQTVHAAFLRFTSGQADYLDLARSLNELDDLFVLIPPGDFMRFMMDLDAAVKEKGIGNVKTGDAEEPRLHGHTRPDGGFLPRAFTDGELAREYAVTSGLIEPDAVSSATTRSPAGMLYECLNNGWAGLILDDGTEHALTLDLPIVRRLYAVFAVDDLLKLDALHLVLHGGKPVLQRGQDAGQIWTFAYDSESAARVGIERQRQAGNNTVETKPIALLPLLRQVLASDVTHLFVNPALDDERYYPRIDLEVAIELLGDAHPQPGSADGAPAPSAEGGPAAPDPSLQPQAGMRDMARVPDSTAPAASAAGAAVAASDPVRRARRYRTPDPVPASDGGDDTVHARFQELRTQAEEKTIQIWEYVDALGFELALYVPQHPERVDGLVWPQLFRHPNQENKTATFTFTQEEVARKIFSGEAPKDSRFLHLSGIEAMRWAYGAPRTIDEITIDLYPETGGWVSFPSYWALTAIYPHFAEIPSLDDVIEAGLARAGSVPGARGTKPEVLKSLVRGWKQLWSVSNPDAAADAGVQHGGGAYLPIFTDPDQFFAFAGDRQGFSGKPEPAGESPPFGRWLRAAADCQGLILDPAGAWPLPLDHTDLLVLDLWTRTGSQPRAHDIIEELARLRGQNAIDPEMAARIAADWPRYFAGVMRRPDGGADVLMLPEGDWCALFTSYERAQTYIQVYKNLGFIKGDMQPVPLLHRWDFSVFRQASDTFEDGAWLDPLPMDDGGLPLERSCLGSALEQIHARLAPRVPGFAGDDAREAGP